MFEKIKVNNCKFTKMSKCGGVQWEFFIKQKKKNENED